MRWKCFNSHFKSGGSGNLEIPAIVQWQESVRNIPSQVQIGCHDLQLEGTWLFAFWWKKFP
jgi:hypothetical protein